MNEESKAKPKYPTGEKKLKRMVRDCVLEMILDRELKPSDRLSAVKTLMEYFSEKDAGGEVRIVLDSVPDGFAD